MALGTSGAGQNPPPCVRWMMGAVFLAALALRIGLAAGALTAPDRSLTYDGVEYLALAHNLADGHGFVRDQILQNGQHVAVPEVFRTLGYPVFLAAVESLSPERANALVVLIQIVIGSISCVLIFAITHRLTHTHTHTITRARCRLGLGFRCPLGIEQRAHSV